MSTEAFKVTASEIFGEHNNKLIKLRATAI